jgi:hypothetical protein
MKTEATFYLTEEQIKALEPLIDRMDKETDNGNESVIIAQLYVRWDCKVKALVGFVDHKHIEPLRAALNTAHTGDAVRAVVRDAQVARPIEMLESE